MSRWYVGCCLFPVGIVAAVWYMIANRLRIRHRTVQWLGAATVAYAVSIPGFIIPGLLLWRFFDLGMCDHGIPWQATSPDGRFVVAHVSRGCGGAAGSVFNDIVVWDSSARFGRWQAENVVADIHRASITVHWRTPEVLVIAYSEWQGSATNSLSLPLTLVYHDARSGQDVKVVQGQPAPFERSESLGTWLIFVSILTVGQAVWFGTLRPHIARRGAGSLILGTPWLAIGAVLSFLHPPLAWAIARETLVTAGFLVAVLGTLASLRRKPAWMLPPWYRSEMVDLPHRPV